MDEHGRIYLGDGVYLSRDGRGGWVLTANHHDPEQATDRVWLELSVVRSLVAALVDELNQA